ncbi:unnamed protein product (macronuclear) [Paramecium tetraurelia]|uniref:PSI domain-containing protein n=1 Tax=Paramecium tetraurelia TaxID=5888 RepID=A0DBA9_PARTE|nr:uncharacterized protein GSPATT00015220001 [Paramecium tetraurelia]CAK80326.1 unnamed protein product [Paramecium tetraurelia]|eukprot:XP_001447723.1 hypothetical protein (macronuclear) [Paramecium tetraurelia strain d4-2]
MKLVLVFLLMCIYLVQSDTTNISLSSPCSCTQLFEYDCYRNLNCVWNNLQLRCEMKSTTEETNTNTNTKNNSYCTQFGSDKCWKMDGCAYILNECVQFTSCSSYPFSVQKLCQMVSSKCITDGEKCVELAECNSYSTPISCVKNKNGKYCYWDQYCMNATDCSKLPVSFKTDVECREQLSYCTVNPRGGCQVSGYNCEDQEFEMQCYYNQKLGQCAWVDGKCMDRSCQTAPKSIRTDAACSEYFQSCTLDIEGGCRQRTQCNDVILKESCTYNANGSLCFWNDGKCYDKNCENAPQNIACSTFLENCVSKSVGGCMSISDCSKYDLEESCKIDAKDNKCFWTGNTCVLYTCQSAPLDYVTHEQCANYKEDCTGVQRELVIMLLLLQQPFSKLIMIAINTKRVVSQNQVEDANYQMNAVIQMLKIACVVDKYGRNCFFYNGVCALRICENAPISFTSHEQCQDFNKECTVARTLIGCVKMTCQVLTSQNTCKVDLNGNRCYWTGLCYSKTCANAPFEYNSDLKCKTYLSSCTIANSGRGCITRPVQCNQLVLEEQFVVGSKEPVMTKLASLPPTHLITILMKQCDMYLSGCTVASEGNGGCIPLDACTTYTAQRSCRFNNSNQLCEWTGNACYDKSCTTAPQDADHDTNEKCDAYLVGCIVAPSGQGCVEKPTSCNMMSTSTQCTDTSTNSLGGPCVWVSSCVNRTCANAPVSTNYDTHQECYTFLASCTVVATGIGGCMTQLGACSSYTTFRSCQLASNGQKCAWQYNYCYNRQCSYAPDTNEFDADTECSSFLNTCTVVRRISNLGCTTRQSSCQDLTEQQCINDSSGTICTWDTTLATPYCKNRACSLMIGFTYTQQNCKNWLSGCVVDNNSPHTSCMTQKSLCSQYTNVDNCELSTSNGYCTWNGSSCVTRTCSTTQNITDFNHSTCNTWLSSCTAGPPTSCIQKPTNCADYVNYDQCYKNYSDYPCTWYNDACIEKTCTNHGFSVTVFNQTNCNNWLSSCSVNPGGTECETTRTCANYTGATFTHSDCNTWLTDCTTDGSQCVYKTCTNYGSNVTTFNNSNCSAWFSECTNDGSTACKSARTCANYGSKVTIFNHTNCTNWLSSCTNTNTACTARTCTNYGQNILFFTHDSCNAWLSSCTVTWDKLGCETKSCTNTAQQITTFNTSNCQAWLSECQANVNGTACESTNACTSGAFNNATSCGNYLESCTYVSGSYCTNKSCASPSGITTYNHKTCTNFYKLCTSNSASSACEWRNCYNHKGFISYFTHESCENWLFQCTVNSTNTGCTVKTCTNYGSHVTSFTNADCNKWHPSCNGATSTCQESRICTSAPTGYQYDHSNCEAYSLSCTKNTSTTCMTKNCSKASLVFSTFTHAICSEWLSTCTSDTNGTQCTSRTCTNYRDQLTTISHATCNGWLSTCTSNVAGTACETKTCYNHGSEVAVIDNTNCNSWKSGCVGGGSTCRDSTNTICGSFSGSITHANCTSYLSTCTNSGTTKCIVRTCQLASQGITTFNHQKCTEWYLECTANSDGTGCQYRTCYNYGDYVTTFTTATCSNWLYGCNVNSTNDGCISERTCSNYGSYIKEFTHENCSNWLSTCTVDSGTTACIDRTCTNYGSNVTVFNYANCNAWLDGCTGTGSVCEARSCSNCSTGISSYTEANCYKWYSYCKVNDSLDNCVSTRTCTNYASNVTTFNHSNCYSWLSDCTVAADGLSCVAKTCTNSNLTAGNFNLNNCDTWLTGCIANFAADNFSNLNTFDHATCSGWKSTCTYNKAGTSDTGTSCIEFTCVNAQLNTFDHTNCNTYKNTCTVNSNGNGCIDFLCSTAANVIASFTDTDCKSHKSTCTVNTDADNCEDITCDNAARVLALGSGSYTHSDCDRWLSSCTVNSAADGCETKTCANAVNSQTVDSSFDCTNSWLSTCELDISDGFCIDKTCLTFRGTLSKVNCNNYFTGCTYYGNYDNTSQCTTTVRTCASAVTAHDNGFDVVDQAGCDSWKAGCAHRGSGNYGCEERSCSNYVSANQSNPTSYAQCNAWLSTCTFDSVNSICVEKTCSNFSESSPSFNNCQSLEFFIKIAPTIHMFIRSLMMSIALTGSQIARLILPKQLVRPVALQLLLQHITFLIVKLGTLDALLKVITIIVKQEVAQTLISQCIQTHSVQLGYPLDRTCYNYSTNLLLYNSSTCESWLSTCTNYKTQGCMPKTCDNYSGTINDSNCQSYLSYCVANTTNTKCMTRRTCTNHGSAVTTFTHVNCENWNSNCTSNGGGNACIQKTLQQYKLTSYTCTAWKSTCAYINGSCVDKTCSNSGLVGSDVTLANCSDWLPYCKANNAIWPQYCELKTCQNHSLGTINQANCQNWLSYCRVNSAGNTCMTDRTCNNYGINILTFNHINCEAWSSYCTVNTTNNGCMNKTCFNTNLSVFNDQTCGQWLNTCKANSSNTGCEIRTCTNYGNQLTSFTSATCSYWLYYCTNNGSTACKTSRTCTSYTTQIQTFTLQTCSEYLSQCVPDPTQSSCLARTCSNAQELPSYTHQNCSNWLSSCTVNSSNNGCDDRTCQNASLSFYNYNSCSTWLSTCTVNDTNDGCTAKTCSNSTVTQFTQANCTAWLSTCTNGKNACINKTCANYTGTINQTNCVAWLSYCYADSASQAQCYSLRNCYNHSLSTFTVSTCSSWSPLCTVNTTNDGCIEKNCYNNNLTKFSHATCSDWLSTCTANIEGTGCEIRSCTNHGSNITIFSNANCSAWWKYCKVTTLGNACEPYTCWKNNVSVFNHTNCYNYLDQCTVADSTSCGSTRTCTNHGSAVTVFNHANCQYWLTKCTVNFGGTACEEMTCTNHGIQVSTFTHASCQNWMFDCTVNATGTDCELKTCSNYGANVVVYTHANCLAWLSTCTANATNSACVNKTCLNTTGISTWTQANCQAWLSVCQLSKPSTCTSNVGNCSSATYNQCVKDTNSDICVWHQNACKDRACNNFTGTANHANCVAWLSSCTVNTTNNGCVTKPTNCTTGGVTENQCVVSSSNVKCAWIGSTCVNRTCAQYSGTFNHTNCNNWLNTCTVNSDATACSALQSSCTSYTAENQCNITSSGAVCFWDTTTCVTRTCEHAPQTTDYNDNTKYLEDAQINCQLVHLTNSNHSVIRVHLELNVIGILQPSICADAICTNALSTITTHADCQSFLNTCTVNTSGGCIPLVACNLFTTQLSCVISNTGDTCEWQSGTCNIKSCATAAQDATRDTYEECQAYLSNCTVVATGLGGCVALNDCSTYTSERQCKVNSSGSLCGWNGLICANRACSTAPPTVTYSNDYACQDYMDGCTVVETGYGCQSRKSECSDYKVSKQCVKTTSNQLCYWNTELPIPACENRTCFNAPSNSLTPELCEQHSNLCYSNMQYCRLEECDDLLYSTDFECKYFNSKCTTNGTNCIVRKKCQDVKNSAGCVTDDSFNECEWYNQECVLKSCSTAPAYKTEVECNLYKEGCTTKLFGGCRQKTICSQANVEQACTTSNSGEICVWKDGFCRSQRCEDFDGTYDEFCDTQKKGCVSDGIKCIQPRYCSQILLKEQCLKGVDGPCVWYEFGCTLFLSCQSILSNLDRVCKSANSLCTTDGFQCVGLEKCANYRLQEACKTGLDGNCQWIESSKKCLLFAKCTDLPFLTHSECQNASSKCTTDTLNGCYELQQCFNYQQKEQCKISSQPQKVIGNQVLQTGYCAWINGKCRDQLCEDLSGETHESCQTKLKGCTSDGTNCITMQPCQQYSNLITCNLALGTDGKCFFSNFGCRALECTDIKNGTNHFICQSYNSTCISDGTQCISQTNCQIYPNYLACTFKGLDGQCAWNGSNCNLMKSCEDAVIDMIACQRMGDLCNWNSFANGTTACLPHTCQTKGVLNQCNYIKDFSGKTISTCLWSNEICQSVDPRYLQSTECNFNTLNTYRWNPVNNTCESCSPQQVNNTNTTVVSYLQILSIVIIYAILL